MAWFLSKHGGEHNFHKERALKTGMLRSALQHKFFEAVSLAEVVAVRVYQLSTIVNKIAEGVEGTLNFWHFPVIPWRMRANSHEKPTTATLSQPIFQPGIYRTWHEPGAASTSPEVRPDDNARASIISTYWGRMAPADVPCEFSTNCQSFRTSYGFHYDTLYRTAKNVIVVTHLLVGTLSYFIPERACWP
jgi:hypothetical protein